MQIWNKLKENWAFVLSILIIGIITFIEISSKEISSNWLIVLLVFSGIFALIDKTNQDDFLTNKFAEFKDRFSNEDEKREKQNKIIEEQIQNTKAWETKTKVSLNLVRKLIEEGLIDREDINQPSITSKIFALYCFPKNPYVTKDNKIKHRLDKRIYPEFLRNLGFIRLHVRRGLFYVIRKDRLSKDLQNTFSLKKHILSRIEKQIPEEWKSFLVRLKRKHSLKNDYNELKDKSHEDVMGFNILLLNTDISENNVGYLYDKRAFSDEFHNFLKEQIDLRKLNIQKDVKIKVSDYIKNISFELFFFEEKQADVIKLKGIEGELKKELNIDKWEDYLKKNDKDIANIIKKAKFTPKKALALAKLLKERVQNYQDALRDIGVKI